MSKLRDLIEQGPALCAVRNADQWSALYLGAFDAEVADKGSAFATQEGQSIGDRLEVLKGIYRADGCIAWKADYWIMLLTLCAVSYAISQKREGLEEDHDNLLAKLTIQEPDVPKFSAIMPVAEAGVLSNWL